MTQEDIIKKLAVDIIREQLAANKIKVKQIILFGSHARKTAQPDSDWDFMVCVEDELAFHEKAKIITAIQRKLAEKHVSVDIIIKSEKRMNQERTNVGVITYYALKEGVLV
jgi:predicted nucleotidyltransferase